MASILSMTNKSILVLSFNAKYFFFGGEVEKFMNYLIFCVQKVGDYTRNVVVRRHFTLIT
jgi:hypothetical protein